MTGIPIFVPPVSVAWEIVQCKPNLAILLMIVMSREFVIRLTDLVNLSPHTTVLNVKAFQIFVVFTAPVELGHVSLTSLKLVWPSTHVMNLGCVTNLPENVVIPRKWIIPLVLMLISARAWIIVLPERA